MNKIQFNAKFDSMPGKGLIKSQADIIRVEGHLGLLAKKGEVSPGACTIWYDIKYIKLGYSIIDQKVFITQ